jgi:hypothetical protein
MKQRTTGEILSEEQRLAEVSERIYKFNPLHVQRVGKYIQIPTDKTLADIESIRPIVAELGGKIHLTTEQVVWIYLSKKKVPSLLLQGLGWIVLATLLLLLFIFQDQIFFLLWM